MGVFWTDRRWCQGGDCERCTIISTSVLHDAASFNNTKFGLMSLHVGSTFESWLDEAGIRAEVTAGTVKAIIAAQLARLLDPREPGVTLDTLHRAAFAVGKTLRIELV